MTAQPSQSGLLLVVSAPSGAGKTTLVSALVRADGNIKVSVSHTTRPRRGAERDGAEYFFVDEATFAAMRGADAFLEHAQVFGNSYGTSRDAVERELAAGHDVLLEIDWQGAQQIRRSFPAAVSLFIVPPSRTALSARLQGRGVDDEAQIRKRTAEAVVEMSHHEEYDYLIVNDRFDDALADLLAIVRAERLRTARQVRRHRELLDDLLSRPKLIQ